MRGREWGRGAHKERHQNGKCISRQTRLPTSRCNQTPSGEWCKCNWKHPWCILWSMPRAPFFSFFRRNVARHPSVPVIKSRFPVISAPPFRVLPVIRARTCFLSRVFNALFNAIVLRICGNAELVTLYYYIRALFLISGNTLGEDGTRCWDVGVNCFIELDSLVIFLFLFWFLFSFSFIIIMYKRN